VPPVAIVGGGILGLSLAYFLSKQGIPCEVFEASPVMGGLAGPRILDDGTAVDRYYHTILSSDTHLADLCVELGIENQLRFRQTRSTFYIDGGFYSMNSVAEFLRFRPLTLAQRAALGATVARAQFYRDWQALESVSLREWLTRLGGRAVFERLWGPMLKAKFDGSFDEIPATWMWSRLVRMKSTRKGPASASRRATSSGATRRCCRPCWRAWSAPAAGFTSAARCLKSPSRMAGSPAFAQATSCARSRRW
jgi:protoporphyrinogen oxidase